MNFKTKIENFLMNQFGGKILARAAVSIGGTAAALISAWVGSDEAQAAIIKGIALAGPILKALNVQVEAGPIDQTALGVAIGGALVGLAHAGFEWFKKKRAENPLSPTVQTDPAKPNAGVLPEPLPPK